MKTVCKHCGCALRDSDECINIGWCVLMAAGRPDATDEQKLIADALANFTYSPELVTENDPSERVDTSDLRSAYLSSALW